MSFKQVGWGVDQSVGGFGDEPGVKAQLLNLVRSVRTVMRGGLALLAYGGREVPTLHCAALCPPAVPLIAVNSVCIVLLLLFG